MLIDVSLVAADEVRALRDLRRKELDCQILLDSWYERGWTDAYLFRLDGRIAGYGLVGGVRADPKDTVTEFYVLPIHRAWALPLFRELARVSLAKNVEVQTNDIQFTLMVYDTVSPLESTVILFHDAITTNLAVPGAMYRKVTTADQEQISRQKLDSDAEWLIEAAGTVVATGGILFHYNIPYGDIYMGVAESFRRTGYGSFLVQELKRTCYEMGRIPAARCNSVNSASRATLQKAGMIPCARVLTGPITIE